MTVTLSLIQPAVTIALADADPQVLAAVDADTVNGTTPGATGLALLAAASPTAASAALPVLLSAAATLAAGALQYGAGTNSLATLAPGTGLLQLNGAAAPTITTAPTLTGLTISGAAGSVRVFSQVMRGANVAWLLAVRDATDNLRISAYDDAGAVIDYPLTITRAAGGLVAIPRPVVFGATASLGSEIARFAAGSAPGTPGETDVLVGAGTIACGGSITAANNSSIAQNVNAAATFNVINTNAGASAYARLYVQNDAASPRTIMDVYSSGYTGTLGGITLANWNFIGGSSGASSGLMIGHTNARPIVFVAATAELARFTGGTLASDSFAVKYTTASTSTITGALTVAGGVGVVGRVSAAEFASGATKVLGAQGAAVADASGGATVDAEARTAINALLARMRAHGAIAT